MRAHPRYPVSLDATLITPDGRVLSAVVTDLSMGGAGVQTNEDVTDLQTFTLVITEGKIDLCLECEVREVRDLWSQRMIHARFLSSETDAALQRVIKELRAQLHNEKMSSSAPAADALNAVRHLFRRRAAKRAAQVVTYGVTASPPKGWGPGDALRISPTALLCDRLADHDARR